MNLSVRLLIFISFIAVEGFSINLMENLEKCDRLTFEKLISTLYKNVEFMSTRGHQLNIDAAFGLTVTQANIDTVLTSKYANYLDHRVLNVILEIRRLSDETRQFVADNLKTEDDRLFSKILTRVDKFVRPINWGRKILHRNSKASRPNLGNITADSFIFDGAPQENESDYCILQLISQHLNEVSCQLSDECARILLLQDGSRGFATTHRLLIVQIANILGCAEHPNTDFQRLIEEYCEDIYEDLTIMQEAKFPSIAVDLAIEQMLVCGWEGYSQFLTNQYKNLIINWPTVFGCYTSNGLDLSRLERWKRSSTRMDYGCESHTSGVASATLSLLIRECIDNNNWIV